MLTGHHRTIAKKSNGILVGLTDQRKTSVTKYGKLVVLLKKIVSEIMFGWCLTFDSMFEIKFVIDSIINGHSHTFAVTTH